MGLQWGKKSEIIRDFFKSELIVILMERHCELDSQKVYKYVEIELIDDQSQNF